MRAPWSKVPALPLAVGFAAGIALASLSSWGLWAFTAAVCATFALWWSGKLFPALFTLAVAAGVVALWMRTPEPPPPSLMDRDCLINGHIAKVQKRLNVVSCVLSVDSVAMSRGAGKNRRYLTMHPYGFKLQMTVFEYGSDLLPGDNVLVKGKIQPLQPVAEPIPGKTDFNAYAFIEGVTASVKVHPSQIDVIGHHQSWFQSLAIKGSRFLHGAVARLGCDGPTSAFLLAIVAGDGIMLPQDKADSMRALGVAHILALSGMHLGILVLLTSLVLMPVRMSHRLQWLSPVAIIVLVGLFAIATGLSASIARAAVVVAVYMLADLLQRHRQHFNSLCVAVIVWLIINPWWLFSPGFQLSVAAVLAVVCLSPLFAPDPKAHGKILVRFLEVTAVSIAAFAGTSILALCYFHNLPLLFLPANIAAALLVPPILALAAFGLIFVALGTPLSLIAVALDFLYGLLDSFCGFLTGFPGATLTGIYPEPWQVWVAVAAIALLCFGSLAKRRWAAWSGGAFLIAVLAVMVAVRPSYPDELYLTDSEAYTCLIAHHHGECIAISPQGSPAVTEADNTFAEFLGRRGAAEFKQMPDSFNSSGLRRQGDYVSWYGHNILLLTNDSTPRPFYHIHYLVIGARFTGDPVQTARTLQPDTVVLAASLNNRRLRRYQSELATDSIPFIAPPATLRIDKPSFLQRAPS